MSEPTKDAPPTVAEVEDLARPITTHEVGRGDLCYCKAHQREWEGADRARGRCGACGLLIWLPFNPREDGVMLSRGDYDSLLERLERLEKGDEKAPEPAIPPWEPKPFIRDAEGFISVRLQQGSGPRNGAKLSELVDLVRAHVARGEAGGRCSRHARRAMGHLSTATDLLRVMEKQRRK